MLSHDSSNAPRLPREFATTRWSVVVASKAADSTEARLALEQLCQIYWYPVYAFLRRKGKQREDARDLTQSFFLKVLQRDFFQKASPERGTLRSFLLKSVQNHMVSDHRATAIESQNVSLDGTMDFGEGERRFQAEPVDGLTAEQFYERKWALTLLDGAIAQLRRELLEKFGADMTEQLIGRLSGDRSASLREMASEHDVTETALKVRVHRMRQRFKEILHQQVAHTLGPEDDVAAEIQRLRELI